jgi:hypothetical protein
MACSGSFVALAAIAGVLPDELDEVLLADLDRFGEERGHVAHSRVDRVRTLNSPNIEYERARAIVDALKGFGEIVEAVGESKSGSACKQGPDRRPSFVTAIGATTDISRSLTSRLW